MDQWFTNLSRKASDAVGSHYAFFLAFLLIFVWGVSGPIFNFSTQWSLFINTTTTIITFLMVFLIQSSQNEDTVALHAKIDELIRVTDEADDALIHSERE